MKKSKIGDYAEKTLVVVSAVMIIWFFVCVIDVNMHNMTDLNYSSWNFIRIFNKDGNSYSRKQQNLEKNIMKSPKIKKKSSEKPEDGKKQSKKTVSDEDLISLARLIEAENGSHKDYEALILTGAVVIKRTEHDNYPDTIMGVISQRGQYSTYADGKFWNNPSKRSIKAAKLLLETSYCDSLPDNLVYQAEFRQGKAIYKKIGHEYFCLE